MAHAGEDYEVSAVQQLRTLLASAPQCVREAWFDFEEDPFASRETALDKAIWAEEMGGRFFPAMHRPLFRQYAALLRDAIPTLPEVAVSEIRQSVDQAYSESETVAYRRCARRRRRAG